MALKPLPTSRVTLLDTLPKKRNPGDPSAEASVKAVAKAKAKAEAKAAAALAKASAKTSAKAQRLRENGEAAKAEAYDFKQLKSVPVK